LPNVIAVTQGELRHVVALMVDVPKPRGIRCEIEIIDNESPAAASSAGSEDLFLPDPAPH